METAGMTIINEPSTTGSPITGELSTDPVIVGSATIPVALSDALGELGLVVSATRDVGAHVILPLEIMEKFLCSVHASTNRLRYLNDDQIRVAREAVRVARYSK